MLPMMWSHPACMKSDVRIESSTSVVFTPGNAGSPATTSRNSRAWNDRSQ